MKKFVLKNETMDGIVYKTENVVIQQIQNGKQRKRCYIIGNGHSLNVDANNVVTWHDPGMCKFQPKISDDNTVYAFYFTFECSGLEESSKEIAKFVNNLSAVYEQIFLIGHSKCGLCLYNASYYCKNITLVTISTPFGGTIVADKKTVERKLKSRTLKKVYNMIFSDHNVDKDIIPNSQFIQNMNDAAYKEHINITSSLENIFSCKDIMDLLLFVWDKIMQINGDGLVPLDSQKINSTQTVNLFCSHANSLKEGLKVIEKL